MSFFDHSDSFFEDLGSGNIEYTEVKDGSGNVTGYMYVEGGVEKFAPKDSTEGSLLGIQKLADDALNNLAKLIYGSG